MITYLKIIDKFYKKRYNNVKYTSGGLDMSKLGNKGQALVEYLLIIATEKHYVQWKITHYNKYAN